MQAGFFWPWCFGVVKATSQMKQNWGYQLMAIYRILVASVLALTACTTLSNAETAATVAATSVNLPMGLPLMPGATVKSNNNGVAGSAQKNAAAILITTESVDAAFEFYTGAMNDAGFASARETQVGDIRTVTASRDGKMGMVTVKPDAGSTMIMIVSRGEP